VKVASSVGQTVCPGPQFDGGAGLVLTNGIVFVLGIPCMLALTAELHTVPQCRVGMNNVCIVLILLDLVLVSHRRTPTDSALLRAAGLSLWRDVYARLRVVLCAC